ncbi:MAG: hypothetical protein JSS66_04805 [Armatimonadetes bacterium]|nr:hypothetical protein [Armatimonadota bacterium]
MNRTIPGGKVESVFRPSKDGKEVVATNMMSDDENLEEAAQPTEETETDDAA